MSVVLRRELSRTLKPTAKDNSPKISQHNPRNMELVTWIMEFLLGYLLSSSGDSEISAPIGLANILEIGGIW